MKASRLLRFIFLFALLITSDVFAEPTAVATLTRKEIALGEDVDLEVSVQGGGQWRFQGAVQIDGLEISGPRMDAPVGFGNLMNGGGGGIKLIFSITPLRTGNFTIPAIPLSVDGRAVRTEPIALRVVPDNGSTSQKRAQQPTLGLLELLIPDGPYYVGQMIPTDIRLSGASSLRWQPEAMPEMGGEGFTKLKFPEPKQQQGERDGEALDLYVFHTAITPSKAGKLTIGPVTAPYAAIVPRAKPRRQRSFFDDIFSDPAFGETRHTKAEAPARELEVKPLPTVGKPESFSGGIGEFIFTAEGTPARVKVGDPVTMKLTVRGRGNFDRIEAPTLKKTEGWRTYPPSADFRATDELGLAGTKTFSVAVIPERTQQAMPVFEFSYFDPKAGKYVTLTSDPAPLFVEGAAPVPQVAAATALEPPAAPPPEPAAPTDILGLRYDAGPVMRGFAPLYRRVEFWAAQAVPAVALLGWVLSRRRRTSEAQLKRRELQREKARLLARLRAAGGDAPELLETAAQILRIDTAMRTGRPVNSVDAASVLASRPLDEETKIEINALFNAREELLFAGAGGGEVRISTAQREHVRKTIERFEADYATR